MFGYRFVRNWPTICPIGGMVNAGFNGAKAALRALLGPYLAAFRSVSAGLVTPSSPVRIRTVNSAFCGPYQALTGLYHFVAGVPIAALPAAANGDGRDAERHRDVGIGRRAGKGRPWPAGDGRDRALGRQHDR